MNLQSNGKKVVTRNAKAERETAELRRQKLARKQHANAQSKWWSQCSRVMACVPFVCYASLIRSTSPYRSMRLRTKLEEENKGHQMSDCTRRSGHPIAHSLPHVRVRVGVTDES